MTEPGTLRVVGAEAELAELDAGVRARLLAAARLATLEDLLRFGFAQRPAWELVDVVVQDEFTHDVIVRAPRVFLVFDTT